MGGREPLEDIADQATVDHEAFRHLQGHRLDIVPPQLMDRFMDLKHVAS